MTAPQFTNAQGISLAKLGLSRCQITKLELTLPLAKAWMDADVPPMQDVRDVLNDSSMALDAAMNATMKLLHPSTLEQREASYRVIDADCDADQEGGAVMDAFHALVEASCVLDKSLDALPKNQRRLQTSVKLFQRIDKALLEGFIEDAGIRIHGMPSKPYQYLAPSRYGNYSEIIGIYYAAIGRNKDNPDRAIRNYMAWLDGSKSP
jgi:hypothetical protein